MDSNVRRVDWSKWSLKENCFAKYSYVQSKLIYGNIPNEKPDVSIMIPTYHRADLLEEAIQSALQQNTRFRFTISVVDNDSNGDMDTDNLMQQYCTEYQNILYYRNEQNIGMFGNWNRCIELSQTEWLCLLHDDDMLMKNYIETLFSITKTGKYGAVCGFRRILDQRADAKFRINETGKDTATSLLMNLFIRVRKGLPIPLTVQDAARGLFMPSMANLLNRTALLEVGGFDEQFFPCADVACYTKVEKYYEVLFVPQLLYWYRLAKNESLKEETCWKMISASASLVRAISKTIDLPKNRSDKNFYEEVIKTYYTFANTREVIDIDNVVKHFALPGNYSNRWRQRFVIAKYNLRWGMMIFRKSYNRK